MASFRILVEECAKVVSYTFVNLQIIQIPKAPAAWLLQSNIKLNTHFDTEISFQQQHELIDLLTNIEFYYYDFIMYKTRGHHYDIIEGGVRIHFVLPLPHIRDYKL